MNVLAARDRQLGDRGRPVMIAVWLAGGRRPGAATQSRSVVPPPSQRLTALARMSFGSAVARERA